MEVSVARISEIFEEGAALKNLCRTALAPSIASAASALIAALDAGGKILSCGNGGSAADAQHFSSELLNRFERERRELSALALTTDASTVTSIGNDYDFAEIFAKQVRGLGRAGDVLLAFPPAVSRPTSCAPSRLRRLAVCEWFCSAAAMAALRPNC